MSKISRMGLFGRARGLVIGNGLKVQLIRSGIGSVVVKVGGMGLLLTVSILLARALEPDGYGVYSFVFALISFLAIPAQFGLPVLIMRETAKAYANADWATLLGVWRWTTAVACGSSLVLVVLGGLVAWLFSQHFSAIQLKTFGWGLALVPLLVLGRLIGGALRGLHCVVAGQLPDIVLRPGFLVIFVLVVIYAGLEDVLTANEAMALHSLAGGFALVIGGILLWRERPAFQKKMLPNYLHRAWAASVLPLGFVAALQIINLQSDILMLGIFANIEQVGVYRVAVQGATLVTFGLQVVNMVIAPQIARMYNQDQHAQLQRLVTISAQAALVIAFPITLVYVFFGDELLGLIVGPKYIDGSIPLGILAIGQLVSAAMGSVVLLLNMTNHEQSVARGLAFAAIANVLGNFVLIPLWGMNGAAVATTLTFVIWNLLLVREVSGRLNINSTAFHVKRTVL